MKKKSLLERAEELGYEVTILHYRPYNLVRVSEDVLKKALDNDGLIPMSELNPVEEMYSKGAMLRDSLHKYVKTHGGVTVVTLRKGEVVHSAEAECSDSDAFSYRSGVVKALGRALGKFNECLCSGPKHSNCCEVSQQSSRS